MFTCSMSTLSQSARYTDPMLGQCWAIVCDAGPALNQHCVSVSCRLLWWPSYVHSVVTVWRDTWWAPRVKRLRYDKQWYSKCYNGLPANTRHSLNAVSMLGQCRRRWPNIETALNEHLVFTVLMLVHWWTSVADDGPTMCWHWAYYLCVPNHANHCLSLCVLLTKSEAKMFWFIKSLGTRSNWHRMTPLKQPFRMKTS